MAYVPKIETTKAVTPFKGIPKLQVPDKTDTMLQTGTNQESL
jgi:hypothetical protein